MPRRRFACCLAVLVASTAPCAAFAGEPFPFGSELMLDTATPQHGSKRLPMIEIEDNGATTLDLWCGSVRGQAAVGDNTISFTPGVRDNGQCDPDRIASDDDMLDMLVHMTKWRRIGDVVELSGATTLRFRLMTN
jgi:META domain